MALEQRGVAVLTHSHMIQEGERISGDFLEVTLSDRAWHIVRCTRQPIVNLTHWPLGDFRWVLFKPIAVIDGWDACCEIALRRISLDLTDKATLVQVMAWCHQATSHYLSQCWPSFLSPYGVTRPQWVNPMCWYGHPHCSAGGLGHRNFSLVHDYIC